MHDVDSGSPKKPCSLWVGDISVVLPTIPDSCCSCIGLLSSSTQLKYYLELKLGSHIRRTSVISSFRPQWPHPIRLHVAQDEQKVEICLFRKRAWVLPDELIAVGNVSLINTLIRGLVYCTGPQPMDAKKTKEEKEARISAERHCHPVPLMRLKLFSWDIGSSHPYVARFDLILSSPFLRGAEEFQAVANPFLQLSSVSSSSSSSSPPIGLYYSGKPTPSLCHSSGSGVERIALISPPITETFHKVTFVISLASKLLFTTQTKQMQSQIDRLFASIGGALMFGVLITGSNVNTAATTHLSSSSRSWSSGIAFDIATGELRAFGTTVGRAGTKQIWLPFMNHYETLSISLQPDRTLRFERSGVHISFVWSEGQSPPVLPQNPSCCSCSDFGDDEIRFAVELNTPRYFISILRHPPTHATTPANATSMTTATPQRQQQHEPSADQKQQERTPTACFDGVVEHHLSSTPSHPPLLFDISSSSTSHHQQNTTTRESKYTF